MDDKEFIYNLKKLSNYKYIETIWGWDEAYQEKDFDSDFNLHDFQMVTVDGKDIGFIQIIETSETVNITEIHLISAAQGKGIGSSIIRNIIQTALDQGKTVCIGCFKENKRAFRLYLSLGFKLIDTTESHYLMMYRYTPQTSL